MTPGSEAGSHTGSQAEVADVFTRIRSACARVAAQARQVCIDAARLDAFAATLAAEPPGRGAGDPAHEGPTDPQVRLAFVVTLDAINFGSGWFPVLHKPDGRSGYYTIATALRARFDREGPWSAAQLRALDAVRCAEVFGQDSTFEAGELMALFARSLNDLGALLERRFDGRFELLVAAAEQRASRLVALLAEMPSYRDVSTYAGFEVPFYKRAQITAADLAQAFHGEGPGRFTDLEALTLFADNLVPHVLRTEGVLRYDPALAERIDRGLLLDAGSPAEVEIRACAVHAVEGLVERLRAQGLPRTAQQLDFQLWTRGQRPEIKARPRHRARCMFY